MTVRVGQVYEDTYLVGRSTRWLVKVMKLNAKSARVEPVEDDGWFIPVGNEWQYRQELRHFENGRMALVKDVQE